MILQVWPEPPAGLISNYMHQRGILDINFPTAGTVSFSLPKPKCTVPAIKHEVSKYLIGTRVKAVGPKERSENEKGQAT